MKKLIVSVVMFVLTFCHMTQSETVEDVIESCLMKILKKYFQKKSVLFITDLTTESRPFRGSLLPNLEKEYHRQIFKKIMAKKFMLQIYNTDKYMGLPARLKLNKLKNCFFFIRAEISSSDVLFEVEMDRLHQNPLWDPTGRNIIVAKGGREGNNSEALARKIIEKLWVSSKAVDNLVLVAEENGVVQLYTWFPYRQPDCNQVRNVVLLDTFSRGRFRRKSDLFPVKMANNLEGCELVAATDTCIPYVFAEASDGGKFLRGLEVRILNILSKKMNFKLSTVTPPNMWSTSINKSLAGAFKLLVEQRADMAFSCLMLNQERYLLAQPLPSYYEDSLVWFVPSPSYKTHVADILYTFPGTLWLLMVFAMSVSGFLVFVASCCEHGANIHGTRVGFENLVKLIGLSLYGPVEISTKNYTFRLFIFLFFMYSMHITIAFQSSLFALYRQPQYNLFYSSLKQAVDSGLFVYLRPSSEELYNQSDHDLWNKILRPGRFDYLNNFGEVFSRIAFDKSAVALFIKTTGIYMISAYFTDEYGAPQILWLSQKFATYPVTIYLSPGHPLYTHFENQIQRLLTTGLVRFWLQQIILSHSPHWTKSIYVNNPLSLKHIGGAFFLLLLLLSSAVFTFLGEVFLYRVLAKPKDRKKSIRRHFFLPVQAKRFRKSDAVTIVRVGYGSERFLMKRIRQ